MPHGLVVRARAREDVQRNGDWMRRNLTDARSTRWVARIVAAIEALTSNPEQHPEAEEAADLSLPLRCKLYGRRPHVYRILFTIDGNTVNVLRVLHAAQDRVPEGDL